MHRRRLLAGLIAVSLLAACGLEPRGAGTEVREALAPTGTLRIGVYPGSPTSLVRGPGPDEMRGVGVDIGRQLARQLNVPAEIVVFDRVAEVIEALKVGRVDVTITNATVARAREVNFTTPLIDLELGYLIAPGSSLASIDGVDRPGVRIGVSQGSSSQGVLSQRFKHAAIVPAPSLRVAADLLRTRQIDAFATNKAILFELADAEPGTRVLDGRWGTEHVAIAIPVGRDAGKAWLQRFADEVRASGAVQRAALRAGLRGTAAPEAH